MRFLVRNVYHLFADKFCDLPHIENGKIAPYYYNFKGYYFPMRKDKKLSYSCVAGYTTETGTQEGRITCTAKGWSPVPRCYSELALLSSLLFLVGNFSSSISLKTSFKIHEKLQYKCNLGYHTPNGGTEDTVQCQADGWSSQPSCTKNFGRIVHFPPYNLYIYKILLSLLCLSLNETLQYECDEGYHTAGGNTTEEARCLAHGWSLTPNCTNVRNKCPPPPLPPHARVTTVRRTYHNGDKVRIQCQSKFEIRGYEEIQCENGKWTSPPICIGYTEKQPICIDCNPAGVKCGHR
uniref:Sushi domain-containing protein n=1 Tax=Cairina moschata TaxID=8855 RepID=A0A8C3CL60_CAIMO